MFLLPGRKLSVAIVVLAFLTRIRAFLATPGDSNVGTYYYVAHTWLAGSLPYVKAWEYKPPGLFALCAAGLLIFHDSLLAAAALALVAVIVTACATYAIVAAGGDKLAANLAALCVVFLSTENSGILGDAEIFVNLFAALSFAFVTVPGKWRPCMFAGIAGAAAVQMKLTAVPIVVAAAAMLLVRFGVSGVVYAAAFLALVALPFLLEAIVYARAGSLTLFLDANGFATLRRAAGLRSSDTANTKQWFEEIRILAPLAELGIFAALRPSKTALAALLWLLAALAGIISASEYYDRHFVLLVPPVSMLGSLGFTALVRALRGKTLTAATAAFLVSTFFLHDYYELVQGSRVAYHRIVLHDAAWREGDYPVIRDVLREDLRGDTSLYALQMSPEIYADLAIDPPTRFIFSGDLLERPMWAMIGFSGRDEIARVLETKPHFVAEGPMSPVEDSGSVQLLEQELNAAYRLLNVTRGVRIYKLRSLGAP